MDIGIKVCIHTNRREENPETDLHVLSQVNTHMENKINFQQLLKHKSLLKTDIPKHKR